MIQHQACLELLQLLVVKHWFHLDCARNLHALQVGDLNMCLRSLNFSLDLSGQIGDTVRDSDVLGEIADVYTEMGDMEKAGKVFDLHSIPEHALEIKAILSMSTV